MGVRKHKAITYGPAQPYPNLAEAGFLPEMEWAFIYVCRHDDGI